jgi:hypothetical protein
MRRYTTLLVGVVLLLLGRPPAWSQSLSPALQAVSDLTVLRVARTLDLRADQIAALTPVLQQAQDVAKQRQSLLDQAWAKYGDALKAVNTAVESNNRPDPQLKLQADDAAKAHQDIVEGAHGVLLGLLDEMVKVLDDGQRALIAPPHDAAKPQAGGAQPSPAANPAELMAHQIALTRRLAPNDYDTVRVALAMRLALLVVPYEDNGFPGLVTGILNVEDTVRRMSDAEFTTAQRDLPANIAKFLGLRTTAEGARPAISVDDALAFLSSPQTMALLKDYKPGQPPPHQGAPGGGQQ